MNESEVRIWNYVEQMLDLSPEQREQVLISIEEMMEAADITSEILTGTYETPGN